MIAAISLIRGLARGALVAAAVATLPLPGHADSPQRPISDHAKMAQEKIDQAKSSQAEVSRDVAFERLARRVFGLQLFGDRPLVPSARFFNGANEPLTLSEFKGKALLVNFWATWCTPCVREMPVLNALAGEFSEKSFEVIAIASGSQVGKNPDVFLKENQLQSLAYYQDPHASLMKLFGTKTLPTTLLVDRSGRILAGAMGELDWNSPHARAVLTHLMGDS